MKRMLIPVIAALVLSACAGVGTAVEVDGVSFDIDDIPIETQASVVDLGTFRNALNWVIRDHVLMEAAGEQFGISFTPEELEARAAAALAGLSEADREDPRANLAYFIIQARVGVGGLLWPAVEPLLPAGVTQNQWAIEQLSAAEVDVDTRFGEWRLIPEPLVYAP